MKVTYRNYEALMEPLVAVPTPEELFDFQIKNLKEKGIIKSDKVLRELKKHLPKKGMVLVMLETTLSPNHFMTKVVVNGKQGKNWLTPEYFQDEVQVPEGPYLALDVEDGRKMLGTSPKNARVQFKKEKRSGLVSLETIFLAISFPDILKHHYMDCSGSRYESADWVPGICLVDDWPELDWGGAGGADGRWGSASCGSRVGF